MGNEYNSPDGKMGLATPPIPASKPFLLRMIFITNLSRHSSRKAEYKRYLNSRHTNARGTILGTRSNIKSSRILDSSGVSGIREGNIVETRAGSKRGNLWI